MDELLQRVAELRGMPASLVERSAQARAEKTGTSVEAVLQEWAGEEHDTAERTQGTGDEAEPAGAQEPAPEESDVEPKVEVTIDYLVQLAAEAKRMPPKLILSSATARAEHSNSSLEIVLADWAGVDLEELKKQEKGGSRKEAATQEPPTVADETPPADQEPAPNAAVAVAAAAGAMSMDELLEKVAEVKGMPAALAKRSAEARSKKSGESVEAVLAEWAGVDPTTVTSAPAEEPVVVDDGQQATDDTPEPSPTAKVEVIEASPAAVEEPAEDEDIPVVRGGYPRWLAAAFVLIPLLAVAYILVVPNGPDCGTAGQLLVDPATGEAVNCDGSDYGVAAIDYFAAGASIYSQCAVCHSSDGSGGAGPAFASGAVLSTFPAGSCDQQIEWVRLGTAGWPDPTYGATDKPVGGFGLMPSFGGNMTDEQLASVSLYERVEFGGQPPEEAQVDCGLVESEG
ncbi:MAG: hypothetical protein BMS9Abin12_1234 [Acidimicrobiia bacterium]|nr:MAG: hypothetical protein BMS9Abin12_1234 [Acidimicrobiia bacterium]